MADTINNDFADFRLACEEAPERTFEFAKSVREMIGDVADRFIKDARGLGLTPDTCDGIHDIEARLFAMLRPQTAELEVAFGLGTRLRTAPNDPLALHGSKQDILGRLKRERAFLDSLELARDDGHITQDDAVSIAQTAGIDPPPPPVTVNLNPEPGSFRHDEKLLEEGKGALWMVRIGNDGDDTDYVDLEARALTPEAAADKAEAHARKHADFYFEQRSPIFTAERQNVYRVDEEESAVDDDEARFPDSDAPWVPA